MINHCDFCLNVIDEKNEKHKILVIKFNFLSKSVIENVFESCNCFLSVLRNLILKIKFIYIEIILEIIKFGYHKGSHIQDM
jgi:hypothetical protein